jgi:hypothetical protein
MDAELTLKQDHRGFSAGTTFRYLVRYGDWHVSAATLETTRGHRRIEVTGEELEELFTE